MNPEEISRKIEVSRLETMAVSSRNLVRDAKGVVNGFRSNLGLKAVALVLAVSFWLYIGRTGQEALNLAFPVVPVNVDKNLVVLEQEPEMVRVTLQGAPNTLRRLSLDQMRPVQLSIGHLNREGAAMVSLDPNAIPFSEQPLVRIAGISPPSVQVQLARKARKGVPVKPQTRGELPEGYRLIGVASREKTVLIEGPEQSVADVNAALTTPVKLEGRRLSFSENVRLVGPPGYLTSYVGTPFVTVNVEIEPIIVEKTFEEVPLVHGAEQIPDETRIAVRLRGPQNLLESLGAGDFQVRLSKVTPAPDPQEVRVQVVGLQSGVEILEIQPASVNVRFLATPTPEGKRSATSTIPPLPEAEVTVRDSAESKEGS